MKSIAVQSLSELGGRASVLARQKRDHIRLDTLLKRLGEVPASEQDAVLLRIWRLVFPHAFAEESVLWPVIRRVLPDGEALTLEIELEHQRINELVTELEGLEPGTLAHQEMLGRIVELLNADVRDEEDALLPRLQAKLTTAQLARLGLAWEMVRAIAPTRAHPIVSRRPLGNVLAALPLALLDRLRDLVDARLQASPGRAAPALRRLSRALAGAAHAVERLPGMRQGENPATRIPARRGGAAPWGVAALLLAGAGSAALVLASRRQKQIAAA